MFIPDLLAVTRPLPVYGTTDLVQLSGMNRAEIRFMDDPVSMRTGVDIMMSVDSPTVPGTL